MAIRVLDESGKFGDPLGDKQIAPKATAKTKFNPATESTLSKIARNLYKPVASTLSTLGGLPGDIYNTLASLGNTVSEYTNPFLSTGGIQAGGGLPMAPDVLTSLGLTENVTKPIGETLFGEGSQEPQEGFLEGLTDVASKYAPYTLGGAGLGLAKGAKMVPTLAKAGGGLLTNLLQGTAGQGVKAVGGGPLLQTAAEIATGVGAPALRALTGRRPVQAILKTAQDLKSKEGVAWKAVEEKAKQAGSKSATSFKEAIIKADDKLMASVSPKNRKEVKSLLGEAYRDIAGGKINVDSLVNTRKKINDAFSTVKSGGAKSVMKDVKKSIDMQLEKYLGEIHTNAIDLTRKIKNSPLISEALSKTAKSMPKSKSDMVKNAIYDLLPFAGTAALFTHPKLIVSALGTHLAAQSAKNLKHLLGDSVMKNETLKALKKIGVSGVLPAALNTFKSSKKDEPIKQGPRGIRIVN